MHVALMGNIISNIRTITVIFPFGFGQRIHTTQAGVPLLFPFIFYICSVVHQRIVNITYKLHKSHMEKCERTTEGGKSNFRNQRFGGC